MHVLQNVQPQRQCLHLASCAHLCKHWVASLQDFFAKDCFKGHPKPYADFMDWRFKEDAQYEVDKQRLIPGL